MVNTWDGSVSEGGNCFKCGELLVAPFVIWHGEVYTRRPDDRVGHGHVEVGLHSDCAKEMALHLSKDALECDVAIRKFNDGGILCNVCHKIKPDSEINEVRGETVCLGQCSEITQRYGQ